jgi:uncharacterized membrane protein
MMMRVGHAVLFLLILTAFAAPPVHSESYTPQSLSLTVYGDGTVGAVYIVDVDPTLVRVAVPLFGSMFPDIIVVDENGLPLVTSASGSTVTVDSLGASTLTFTYSTPELTSKLGILWTLNVTSPTNMIALLPTGSTVVSMSQIPLDVRVVNDRTQITLPPGGDAISYVLSAIGTKEHAQTVIQDAEATIITIKAKGVVTTDADNYLAQAKTALNAGEYVKAEQYATDAKASALNSDQLAQIAQSSIQRAETAIQTAKNEGRTSTITTVESLLANAKGYYTSGDYAKAKTYADQAYDSAVTSKAAVDTTLIIAGVVVIVVAAAGIILYTRRHPEPQVPQPAPKKAEDGSVNLEAIFQKNPDLRVDDKEVLRFLAERNGEAFANEIRDRFDIPRTSAWRMIRRLISQGIVEERKIGGQSLIYVVKKYREVQG